MVFLFPNILSARIAAATLFVIAANFSLCRPALAQGWVEPTIVLNTSPGGFAPYTYMDSNHASHGILYDVAHRILKKLGYRVMTSEVPRKRVELQLMSGELDATPRAIEWSEHARDFVFTDPIIRVRSALAIRVDSGYTTVKELHGHRIGTRLGYVYTVLTREFASGQLIRSDATSDLSMLKMLQAKRVEAALVDESAARWLFQREGIKDVRFLLESVDNGVELRLMFAPQRRALVKDFNHELSTLKRSGELAHIIARYTDP
ncbi:substrate-binding periplasmic protein [Candidatus Aalborgicola defluviihabitans]|uniref:substrate-binding periplasmic protein n=1 Tax=Candidatus Aalborgicola defluviihabitans TaxID=3386187 RepID=UPI001EC19669|nr:transporter substrate-binding domain-containing protein [Burkholderiales bacterium]